MQITDPNMHNNLPEGTCDVTPLRRKKRPNYLRLSTFAKAIRSSFYSSQFTTPPLSPVNLTGQQNLDENGVTIHSPLQNSKSYPSTPYSPFGMYDDLASSATSDVSSTDSISSVPSEILYSSSAKIKDNYFLSVPVSTFRPRIELYNGDPSKPNFYTPLRSLSASRQEVHTDGEEEEEMSKKELVVSSSYATLRLPLSKRKQAKSILFLDKEACASLCSPEEKDLDKRRASSWNEVNSEKAKTRRSIKSCKMSSLQHSGSKKAKKLYLKAHEKLLTPEGGELQSKVEDLSPKLYLVPAISVNIALSVANDDKEQPKMTEEDVNDNYIFQTAKSRGRRATISHVQRNENRRSKPEYGWSNMDVLVDGLNLSKADKKKLEKVNNFNIHLRALFAAVEHDQLEKAKNILQNNTFDINSVNADGLNVLEVAVMTGNASIVKTLQKAGATETNSGSVEQRLKDLDELVLTAERRRDELDALISTGNYPKETEKQQVLWDRRSRILRKMRLGLEKLQVPSAPKAATVEVIDGTRVRVGYLEPSQPSSVTTRFKVEWSVDEWRSVARSLELFDLRRLFAVIDRLSQGCRHHFRVSAGNIRGYGVPIETSPSSAIPSSWRDIDNRQPRLEGLLRELEDLFKQVRNTRPEHASEIKTLEAGQETPIVQRKAQKKKSIMQLFTLAPKFQKNLKRGSYLACIIFCEDKVLVTTEDFPPVIEVDENYLSQAKIHFNWLMKVATTWEDVKSLRQDMEQAGSASHLPYRIKFLQAAANMQSVLGIQDLGQFYHKPIKDSSGTYVFCTVKHVKTTKSISVMNVRWVPLSKLRERKLSGVQGMNQSPGDPVSAGEMLLNSLQEQISYSQVSEVPLKRGLYLGYLKLQSSVDQLQVIVPERIPNMFPHIKIRDNPHISREEWEWVQNLKQISWSKSEDPGGGDSYFIPSTGNMSQPSAAQRVWQKQLIAGIIRLLHDLGIEEDTFRDHRLYTGEALDLNCDVTLLLLLPPLDSVCCAPGQEDTLLNQSSLTAMPLHTFEMVHMGTYQGNLLGRYSRLSYILEMDTVMAQHASREAFSENEVAKAKDRLWQLKEFQVILDVIWKRFRWVMDAITFARDKAMPGIYVSSLLSMEERNSQGPGHDLAMEVDNNTKRIRKDPMSKNNEGMRLFKSNTNEDVRYASPTECQMSKSKTSECVFYNSSSSLQYSDPENVSINYVDREASNSNIPLIQWKAEDSCTGAHDAKMYEKDNPTTKSDYLLQHSTEHLQLPPRKSSAPSFLGSELSCSRSKSSLADYPAAFNPSSISLDCLGKPSPESQKDDDVEMEIEFSVPTEKPSPTTSCSDIGVKLSCSSSYSNDKRASSSMSHESEASFSSMTASLRSLSSNETEPDAMSLLSKESGRSEGDEERKRSEEPAIIQVFAAYETGLAAGTSVKLRVTARTTAREVIDLVVKQLNVAVLSKNKTGPIYGAEKLRDFCLVAVIGARERCLRDDFKPMQLQNPWKKGRLYVRLKQDVLAALEQSNSRHSSYL